MLIKQWFSPRHRCAFIFDVACNLISFSLLCVLHTHYSVFHSLMLRSFVVFFSSAVVIQKFHFLMSVCASVFVSLMRKASLCFAYTLNLYVLQPIRFIDSVFTNASTTTKHHLLSKFHNRRKIINFIGTRCFVVVVIKSVFLFLTLLLFTFFHVRVSVCVRPG